MLGASSQDITIRHLFSRWTRHCPFSVGLCETCKLPAPTFSLDGLPGFWSACQLCSIILFNNFVQQKLGSAFCCSSPIKSTWDLSPPPYHRLGKHISSCGQHRYGLFFVHFFGVESFPGGCIFRLFVGFFHTSSDKGQGGLGGISRD